MKRLNKTTQRICFIANSDQSYLVEYLNLSRDDVNKNFTFNKLNLSELRNFDPDIIVIDQYFTNQDYTSIINSIKINLEHAKIYFLSPEYANYSGVIQSMNNKNHLYSSFSVDILNHINATLWEYNNRNNYLEAG